MKVPREGNLHHDTNLQTCRYKVIGYCKALIKLSCYVVAKIYGKSLKVMDIGRK